VKRISVLVLVALVATGCNFLKPREGFGPILQVRIAPPGAQGSRAVDIVAADLPAGTPAATTVRLDNKKGQLLATGATLPMHFTFDAGAAGPGAHFLFVEARLNTEKRRGIGGIDTSLRVNQLQALGTHNSYHEYPLPPIDGIQQLQYFEDPLDVQLQSQGVRQFELDVHVNIAPAGTFSVLHIEGVDENTTCKAFLDCLNTIKTWSDAHPQHIPIGIQLELKNADLALPDLPYRPWVASDLDTLDASIRSVFGENRMLTPDDVRGNHTTLPQAIAEDGWPTINATRGQVMFVMDNSGTFRDWYRTGHDALQGRVIFTNADPGDADAAFIKTNDTVGQFSDIQALVAQGYITRTRADADTFEARANDTTARDDAFASGSTWVSSDFVVPGRAMDIFGSPYFVQIPGGTPARCNPINAPSWCTSSMIEALPAG
jgi:Phosphoinositide phospholipase C, Ca2+-dependent